MHPIFFSVGTLTVYSFGTLIAVGVLLATLLVWRDAKKRGENPSVLLDLGLGLVFFALLGGRILYVLLNLEWYLSDPLEIFRIQHGGLVFYGGLAGAFAFALIFIRKKHLPFWKTLDRMVPYAVLVHAFGRIGCFLNGCCYGKPTESFLGVTFPNLAFPRHPTQLYESGFLFLLFVLLRALSGKSGFQSGRLFFLYLFCYGLFRFVVEFFRGDQETFLWGWTLPQALSLSILFIPLLVWRTRRAE